MTAFSRKSPWQPRLRRIGAAVCFLLLVLVLALPVDLALRFLGSPAERLASAGLTVAMVALLWAIASFGGRWPRLVLPIVLLMGALLVRLLYYGLVHFSGQGFGHELFVHLEPESLRIAWQEYDGLVYRAAGLCLLAAIAFWMMVRPRLRETGRRVLAPVMALVAAVILVTGRSHLPEWQLWQAWQDWQRPGGAEWAAEHGHDRSAGAHDPPSRPVPGAARWNQTGLIDTDLPAKDGVQAEAPEHPRNLILLYVEALTSSIIEHSDYPDLMPNFRRLLREHGWIDEFHTSGYVTIEGIANTQCGLLFPFRGHGSGFAGREMLAQSLPCLGDVLAEAGYHQTYILGGGPISFTGKGDFLASHGYDDLKGWEYWQSHGHQREPGHWGMGDVDTLEQVRAAIAERQGRDRPFNVTALTVGSHIPGYSYETCDAYRDGAHRYLDALHCTDQIVAEWIERLKTDGLLEDSILVILGDHPVFANPDMQGLFGDAIHDTRLPLIVMGDDLAAPAHDRGAGYDLAPTLLDLLGIRHNAEFAMGRSLAAAHDRPDYLVTRRDDIHQGRSIHNPAHNCDRPKAEPDGAQPPSLPLSPCEKRDLMALTRELALSYSRPPTPMDCGAEEPSLLRVPASRVGPVGIHINGRDWSNRFSWQGTIVHPTEPGLYALALDEARRPQARSFLPAESLAGDPPESLPQDILDAPFVLVAWRPADRSAVDLSSILPALPGAQEDAGAWLVQPDRDQPIAASFPNGGNAAVLSIDGATCRMLAQ